MPGFVHSALAMCPYLFLFSSRACLAPAPLPEHPKWSSQNPARPLQARWWMVWSNRIAPTTKLHRLPMRRKRHPRKNLLVTWGMAPSSSPRPSPRGRTVSSSPGDDKNERGDGICAGLASLTPAGVVVHRWFLPVALSRVFATGHFAVRWHEFRI